LKREVGVGGIKITNAEKKLVLKALDSGRLSYGPMIREFEAKIAEMHDSRFALFTNSGTSALHIAVAALKEKYGWRDGDEILVPAITFIATSNVVLHNGLRPVFVDVDPRTYNINPDLIESKITKRTRGIIPVHLLGLPADMDRIMSIARKHNLHIIEDACEAMFAKYKGKSVGSFGEIGCFSTYIAHYIVTGVGGLNTTSDPELAVMLRSLANHGRDAIYISIDDDNIADKKKFHEIVSKRFKFVRLGHSFRATELEAALGLGQLKRKDAIIKRRKQIAQMYLKGLADLSDYIQLPYVPPGYDHVFMLFGIVCKNRDKRALVNHLEDNGIETRDLLPLINQPIYRKIFGNIEDEYPVAKHLNRSAFYIGCHPYMSNEDIKYVIAQFHSFYHK
jgi:perosamine synthetase